MQQNQKAVVYSNFKSAWLLDIIEQRFINYCPITEEVI